MKYLMVAGSLIALISFAIISTQPAEADLPPLHTHEASVVSSFLADTSDNGEYEFTRTETEWKEILTDKEFRILREKGTELPWVNDLYDNKREGIYVCAGCGQKLYASEHKYKSGTGWPSFWKPIEASAVAEKEDNSWFMTRTEIVCSRCGSHIGHVFDDGPEPTGLRYCMNSAAMKFIPADEVAGYQQKES